MFTSKKNKNDVAGSTQRFVDVRRDAPSRYKHFRFVVDSTPDVVDRRNFIEQYAFEAFHLFHELICQVDSMSSHGAGPRNITELEYALWLLEFLLCNLPEYIAQRWQFNAVASTLKKISHPHNTLGLRRIAIRLFVLWYQILGVGQRGADDMDPFFASLVPNLSREKGSTSDVQLLELCENVSCPKSNVADATTSLFTSKKSTPLAPAMAEKGSNVSKGLLTQAYMEKLLEAVSTESTKIEWKTNKTERTKQCLRFLLDKIKRFYAPTTFGSTQMDVVDLQCPKIPCNGNVLRQRNAIILPVDEDPFIVCAQCLARWAAMYSFSHRKQSDSLSHGDQSFNKMIQQQSPSSSMAATTTRTTPETKLPPNFELMREMFFDSLTTTNFTFTILREGFLLPLTYAGTMGRVFKVLREWLTMDNDDEYLPSFFAEPSSVKSLSSAVGVQKSLQTIVSVLASFFNNPYLVEEKERVPLILQISSRVLMLFKYLANSNNSESTHKMTLDSWMFILKVLLNVVRNCLPRTPPVGGDYPLAHRLAPQLYQTLLVTWVFAGLNVVMSSDMWDELLTTTSDRNSWSSLIAEWSKVMESVTRALGSQLYNVDLLNLPLERISEQKLKKIRGKMGENNNLSISNNNNDSTTTTKDLSISAYNFMNTSPSTSTNGPMRPNRKIITTPEPKSTKQHQQISRGSMQKSIDFVESDSLQQTSPPSDVSSLDGSASLDSGVVAGTGVVDAENELKSSLYDNGDNILSLTPIGDVDNDSVSEDFVLPDDVTMIPNCVDDDSPRFNADDGQVFGAPETIAIMWRRMLCSLGDINQILDADIHLSCLEVLNKLVDMLLKIRDNQGVVVDSTPQLVYPPPLVPPYTIFIPWMLKVLSLSERYHKSKLVAVHLLCRLIVRRHDVQLDDNVKSKFYLIVHSILTDGDEELNLSLFRSCGAKIFYLPRNVGDCCAEFLLVDYVRSVQILLNSKLTTQNRQILIHFLCCVVNLPSSIVDVSRFYSIDAVASPKVAQSSAKSFTPIELQKQIVDCLRQNASSNVSSSSQSLKGLIIFVYSSLLRRSTVRSDDVIESVNTLLSCISSSNVDVGHSVCQFLSCLLDVLPTASDDVYSNLHLKIIESMIGALNTYLINCGHTSSSSSMQQNYLVRLLFDVTEWCLRLPKKYINMKKISSSSGIVDNSTTRPIVEIIAEILTSFVHNKFVSSNVKKVAESLISLLIRFFDQQSSQSCHINEWDVDEENSNAFLFLKFRKNSVVSIQSSASDGFNVQFLTRQTAGKDFIEAVRLKNNKNHSSIDVNQWLALKKVTDSQTSCGDKKLMKKHSRGMQKYVSMEKIYLPSSDNADSQSLERMIYFLEKTSPECFPSFSASSNVVGTNDARIETIAAFIDQLHLNSKNYLENEFLNEFSSSDNVDALSSSHLFLDTVLNPSWEKRSQFKLLDKSERLQREFKHVDNVLNREVHKIAVVYVGEGQEDKQSILKNSSGSKNFETFVAGLGYEIDLKQHRGYSGGLPSDGGTTAYWSTSTTEIIFHVSTRSMGADGGDWTKKLRHIGNDEIHIVWSEHWRDYRRNIIPTDFCDVLIVVYPLANRRLFRIQIEKNADVPDFGPLFDGALIEWDSLATLVRCTAINASRAKRLSVDGYKNFLEHRCESLSSTIDRLTVPSSYSNLLRSLYMVGTDNKKNGQRV